MTDKEAQELVENFLKNNDIEIEKNLIVVKEALYKSIDKDVSNAVISTISPNITFKAKNGSKPTT